VFFLSCYKTKAKGIHTPNPTAPRPKTATVDPLSTSASFHAPPNPVENPHEMKLTCGRAIPVHLRI
jgi:hypothetical protein